MQKQEQRMEVQKKKHWIVTFGVVSIVILLAVIAISKNYLFQNNVQNTNQVSDVVSGTPIVSTDRKQEEATPSNLITEEQATPASTSTDDIEDQFPENIEINSPNAVLVRLGGEILLNKGGEERVYPASMTKIMTAIVALENIKNLETKITLHEKIFSPITEANLSVAGFWPDEKVPAIDLLYGLLLPSGAECAAGLAEYVSGTEKVFVDLMNKKAKSLGMTNTHFVNTTGMHHENHYTTTLDMAVLLEYALKNNTFYKIFSSVSHDTKPTNFHSDGLSFNSTMFSKMNSPDFQDGTILGGKTGSTDEAGLCLASLAEKYGEHFILVTCGAHKSNLTQKPHIDDAFTIYGRIRQ